MRFVKRLTAQVRCFKFEVQSWSSEPQLVSNRRVDRRLKTSPCEADDASASSLPTVKRCKTERTNSMQQKQIRTLTELLGSAGTIKAAALAKGADIPLLHNTAGNIGMDADALTTACTNHDAGKVVLANTRAALAALIIMVRAFLMLGRDILKPLLGNEYSQAFDVLGLVGSIAIPRTSEELQAVLIKFKAFFTAHPELEDASRNITAAQCQALYDQLVAAHSNVNFQENLAEELMDTRDQAAEKMRGRIQSLMSELGSCLSPLDPRWLAFGFNKPGAR
jgi:hypothetical protein